MAADKQHDINSAQRLEGIEVALLQSRYQLIRPLGEGGMGKIFMAHDRHLHNRPCVIKSLKEDFYQESNKGAISYFEKEARILSQLQHPNIVQVVDYFEENSVCYLVMEYVEGKDLQQVITEQREPLNEEQVIDWAIQICGVLEYLHNNNPPVIYRDLKPSNIMIDINGVLKLVDFGIARPYEGQGQRTSMVSAGYSPPEQYRGMSEQRSDIYSLGATMHFLLTAIEPIALQVASPRIANPEVSETLSKVVETATAQDLGLRFQTAHAMNQTLLAIAKPYVVSLLPSWSRFILTLLAVTVALSVICYAVLQAVPEKQIEKFMPAPDTGIKL